MHDIIPRFLILPTFQCHRCQSSSGSVSRPRYVTMGAILTWNFVHMAENWKHNCDSQVRFGQCTVSVEHDVMSNGVMSWHWQYLEISMVSENCDILGQWGIATSTISANRQAEIKHKLSMFRKSNWNMILLYAKLNLQSDWLAILMFYGANSEPIRAARSWRHATLQAIRTCTVYFTHFSLLGVSQVDLHCIVYILNSRDLWVAPNMLQKLLQ
jgi:hypothetical protein